MPRPPEKSAKREASNLLLRLNGNTFRIQNNTKSFVENCREIRRSLRKAKMTEEQRNAVKAFEEWHQNVYLPRYPRKINGVEAVDNEFWRKALLDSTFHRELLMQLK